MLRRPIPPPDFRYVGLAPGLSPLHMAAAAAGASTSLAGVLLFATGPDTASLVVSLVAGGLTALTMRRRGAFRLLRQGKARPMAMALVPWGVLIRPDEEAEARVLRWSGVQAIHVESVHTKDVSGSAQTTWSFVTIETNQERLLGRTPGQPPLESLIAHLEAYARESSLPVALGLHGDAQAGVGFDPVFTPLLGEARTFLSTADGIETLSLRSRGYRLSSWAASPETIETLHAVLRDPPAEDLDRRAFAAVVAAEVGAADLLPDLLRLVTTAHPITAAVAKAAALRLGADATKTGALDEVAPFLHDDDLQGLSDWVGRPG